MPLSVALSPPAFSITDSVPRSTADNACFALGARSVVLASSFSDLRNALGSGAMKTGALTRTKSWVDAFSLPGNRSPSTCMILIARPRGVDTLSSRISPGLVEKRMITGRVPPWAKAP